MFVRTIAMLMLLGAGLIAGAEVLQWMTSGHYDTLTAGELWRAFDRASLLRAEVVVATRGARWMWDPVVLSTLRLPTWPMLGATALFLRWYAARRPHPRFFKRRHFSRPFNSGGGRGRGHLS